MPARWAPYITVNVFLESQFRPAEWVPDSCIKLYLESQFRPALRVPDSRANAGLTSQAIPATRVPYASTRAYLESQFRPAEQVPDNRADASLTSQVKPVQPHGCQTAGWTHIIWADSRWYSERTSSGLTPDDTVEVCLAGQFKPARWAPVILADARVAGMAWCSNNRGPPG